MGRAGFLFVIGALEEKKGEKKKNMMKGGRSDAQVSHSVTNKFFNVFSRQDCHKTHRPFIDVFFFSEESYF